MSEEPQGDEDFDGSAVDLEAEPGEDDLDLEDLDDDEYSDEDDDSY